MEIDGVEMVRLARALRLLLSVAAMVRDPAARVALFSGMTKLVTNRPLLSSLTGEPKFILSTSIVIDAIVNEDSVAALLAVKFSPVMATYWLGRAVVGAIVIFGASADKDCVCPAEREANSKAPAKTNR